MHGHLACVKIVIAYTSVSGLKLDQITKNATKKVARYLNLCKGMTEEERKSYAFNEPPSRRLAKVQDDSCTHGDR